MEEMKLLNFMMIIDAKKWFNDSMILDAKKRAAEEQKE